MAKKQGPFDVVNGQKKVPARSLPFFFDKPLPEGWALLMSAGEVDGEELASLFASLPEGFTPEEADQVLHELGL